MTAELPQAVKNSYLATLILLVTVPFVTIEVLVWTGQVTIPQLGNLNTGGNLELLLSNPAFVGIVATLLDGVFSGFMRNTIYTKEKFSPKAFAETFYYYEPMFILVSQFLPIQTSFILVFAVRVAKLAVDKLFPK